MFNQILCQRKNYLQNQVPLGYFRARGAKMGVYDKKPLPCNGHSDMNISKLV